jgi:hypothetical protein
MFNEGSAGLKKLIDTEENQRNTKILSQEML